MRIKHLYIIGFFLASLLGLTNCHQSNKTNSYLIAFLDTSNDKYGYKDIEGNMVIQPGKYGICFTDTFRTYAIVLKSNFGFVGIDRQENILYEVFPFDNGPDYVSEGLFRIKANHKIGYADSATGKIIIKPQFNCAFPFENGVAKVSNDCKTQSDGEHTAWLSDNWFFIDKTGNKVTFP